MDSTLFTVYLGTGPDEVQRLSSLRYRSEATDKLSQTQISDLSDGLATSSAHGSSGLFTNLQSLASNIPGSLMLPRDIDEMSSVSRYADQMRSEQTLRAGPAVNIDPDEIGRTIYPVMAFRDRMMKTCDTP